MSMSDTARLTDVYDMITTDTLPFPDREFVIFDPFLLPNLTVGDMVRMAKAMGCEFRQEFREQSR